MDEKYISVTKFKETLAKLTVEGGTEATRTTIARTLGEVVPKLLDDEPSADVQPVNQWISVNDRLPENAKPCAVVTEDNGLGVSRYMGRNRFEWTLFGELVLYWMPLPEPPKDGDTSE